MILITHPFIKPVLNIFNCPIEIDINYQLFGLLAVILAFLLLSPMLLRFKAGAFEVELTPPAVNEFGVTPAFMKDVIAEVEETKSDWN